MLKLGVNIDHVATVRQARGTDYPDILDAARCCRNAGAHGITMHLREDRRHIQDADVFRVQEAHLLPLNLEMANAPEILDIALKLKPAEVCMVPEKREELTTEGGLDVARLFDALKPSVSSLGQAGTEVSMFIEPEESAIRASAEIGAPTVELHTGSFCDASAEKRPALLEQLIAGAELAHSLGLKVNAGHGINLQTMPDILKIPHLDTLNIGHSIVARAIFIGLENAIREMADAMNPYKG